MKVTINSQVYFNFICMISTLMMTAILVGCQVEETDKQVSDVIAHFKSEGINISDNIDSATRRKVRSLTDSEFSSSSTEQNPISNIFIGKIVEHKALLIASIPIEIIRFENSSRAKNMAQALKKAADKMEENNKRRKELETSKQYAFYQGMTGDTTQLPPMAGMSVLGNSAFVMIIHQMVIEKEYGQPSARLLAREDPRITRISDVFESFQR